MIRRALTVLSLAGALLIAGPINAAEATEGGISTAITVHGHWRIEIFEPDGTLVTVTEFENALTDDGQATLAHGLLRNLSMGAWQVQLDGPAAGGGACETASGTPTYCVLTEPGAVMPDPIHSTNLLVEPTASGFGFQMTGTVVATQTSTIESVVTGVKLCDSSIPPASCPAYDSGSYIVKPFTSTTQTNPPSVEFGQLIQVSVTITFS